MKNIFPNLPILIVDDEIYALKSLAAALKYNGLNNTITCQDSRKVMNIIQRQPIGILLLDLVMPHISGEELLETIVQQYPEIQVIIITGINEAEQAVNCMKIGAFDYLIKPVDDKRLIATINNAIQFHDIRTEISATKSRVSDQQLNHPECFEKIITQDQAMRSIFRYVEAIAPSNQPVLITGESGTGKEEIAKALHACSPHQQAFVPVNVAGLDANVFSDTLFGHVKGAYTGAIDRREGMVKQAKGGTLFLDEIGDLDIASQVKLLRLIQEREYLPLGADKPERAQVRIVVSTNQDLETQMNKGKFRKDLFHRLNTHHVHLPPLWERKGDLPLLFNHFLILAAEQLNKQQPQYPRQLIHLLGNYDFPGNVRELRSMIFDAVADLRTTSLSTTNFQKRINKKANQSVTVANNTNGLQAIREWNSLPTMHQIRKQLIDEALRRTNDNQSLASKMIGISRSTLRKYMTDQEHTDE